MEKYYTIEEVDAMLRQHIKEEEERKQWYLAHPENSEVRKLYEDRNKALQEYFLYPIDVKLRLIVDEGWDRTDLTEKELEECDKYAIVRNNYYTLQATYMQIYEEHQKIHQEFMKNINHN